MPLLVSADWLYWAAALALSVHAFHTQRMPTYWEREVQKYMPMAVPKHVFQPVWLIALVCYAGFGALFFQNAVLDATFDWALVLYIVNVGLRMLWNWFYFTPVSFYPAGPIATLIWGIDVALLVLALIYGDNRAWLIGFIAISIAWSTVAMIFSWFVTAKLGPQFGVMRNSVAKLVEGSVDSAQQYSVGVPGEEVPPETRTQYKAPLLTGPVTKIKPQDLSNGTPLSNMHRQPYKTQ